MNATEFRSEDGRFGLTLPASAIAELRSLCSVAKTSETGGILVGFYTPTGESAVVTRVTGPPKDSKAGATWFHRGTDALNEQLAQRWSKGEFYLGEWHYHPGSTQPVPSSQDCRQLRQIAESPEYHCPEPVLLIASISSKGLSLTVLVFPRGEPSLNLTPRPTPPDASG